MTDLDLRRLASTLVNLGYGSYRFSSVYESHKSRARTIWSNDISTIDAYDDGSLLLRGFTSVEEHNLEYYIRLCR